MKARAHIDGFARSYTVSLVCMLCLLISTQTTAANISASVDRNPVALDESFSLRLTANGSVDADPDLRPLQKDFEVLGTSQSTSMNYVNGNFARNSTWNINLISKRSGTLTIPSISFGKDRSPALRITVNETASSKGNAQQTLFLEAETDTEQTWVQGQVIYTLRLFHSVEMNSASLTPPRTSDPDAIIEKLGEDFAYEAFRDGVRYDVIERRFAIFPQQSGELTIEPTRFEARIGQRRSLFESSNNRIKRLRTPALRVNVEPVPAIAAADAWLPAKQLSIVDEWSQPQDQLTAGEPVTRTISINANGVLASQIPDPEFTDIANIKQYPDQPQNDNQLGRDGINSVKQIKLAMIPSSAGRYRVPEIRLPWWNTRSGQRELAIIPAQDIVVQAGASTGNEIQPVTTDSNRTDNTASLPAQSVQATDTGVWPWLSLLLATAWLLTLGLLIRQRSHQHDTGPSLRSLRKQLITACDNSDADACKQALIAWARVRWPRHHIHNLMDITPLLDDATADELRRLNSMLYSDHKDQWQAGELSRLVMAMPLHAESAAAAADPVEPLYRQ